MTKVAAVGPSTREPNRQTASASRAKPVIQWEGEAPSEPPRRCLISGQRTLQMHFVLFLDQRPSTRRLGRSLALPMCLRNGVSTVLSQFGATARSGYDFQTQRFCRLREPGLLAERAPPIQTSSDGGTTGARHYFFLISPILLSCICKKCIGLALIELIPWFPPDRRYEYERDCKRKYEFPSARGTACVTQRAGVVR